MSILYSATAFWGAFLLFFMQPLAGKALLPSFGGSWMVWATVLTFFQATVFLGYLAVHLLFGRAVTLPRLLLFAGILLFTAFAFPFPTTEEWHALVNAGGIRDSSPIFSVLRLLFRFSALPALLLAMCSVSLQRFWPLLPHHQTTPGATSPYHLYSFSNAGSLAGILALPLFFERLFPLSLNFNFTAVGWKIWAIMMTIALPWRRSPTAAPIEEEWPETPAPTIDWLLPAMAGSALLVATTNILNLDVAGVPLIWMLPLLVYVLSFIIAFQEPTPAQQEIDSVFSADGTLLAGIPQEKMPWACRSLDRLLAAGFATAFLQTMGFPAPVFLRIFVHLFLLYHLCLACHATLFRRRPRQAPNLTRFYLTLSLGGWMGSALLVFAAPHLFRGMAEFPIALFFVAWAIYREPLWKIEQPDPFFLIRAGSLLVLLFFLPTALNRGMPDTESFLVATSVGGVFYLFHVFRESANRRLNRVIIGAIAMLGLTAFEQFGAAVGKLHYAVRTPYGIYRVFDQDGIRYLQMGSTFHGHEMLSGPNRGKPIMYYHPETPIGRFFTHPETRWQRAAVLGLGVGTMAAFTGPGQHIDFYEIDPETENIARRWFCYLGECRGTARVMHGDGRLELRRAPRSSYDLLVMDAFSSDSIPTHLLTLEAIAEYVSLLKPNGLLLFHISNRHLLLAPMLKAAADAFGLDIRLAGNPETEAPLALPTRWVALGTAPAIHARLGHLPDWRPATKLKYSVKPWTDQYVNILDVIAVDDGFDK